MKSRRYYLLSLISILSLILPQLNRVSYADSCPAGMTAYWSLEDSDMPYADRIGSSNLICSSQCPTRVTDGVVGAAGRFQGTNSGLRVPDGTAFNWAGTANFSIELWVRRTGSTASDQVLIGRTDGVFDWDISIGASGTVSFSLADSSNSILLNSSKVLSTPQSVLGARWHHVAVVRNGSSGVTQLFVDGQQAATATGSFQNGFSGGNTQLAVGWSGNDSDAGRFSGDLDEIAVYGRTLDITEIRSHYYLARHYCETYNYPVDIMPLGNSITYDQWISETRTDPGDRFGYRVYLWQQLNQGLYWFDFIGSEKAGQNFDPAFDPDNAGFPGMRTSELLHLMQTSYSETCVRYNLGNCYIEGSNNTDVPYLNIYPTDVIMLHIGTNYLASDRIAGFVNDVNDTLAQVDRYSQNITVLVARIIHNVQADFPAAQDPASDTSLTHQYNDALEQMVDQRIAGGDKLIMVDMEDGAGINYTGADMEDFLHPSPTGYAKMADQWYVSLENFLPQVVLPEITSDPDEIAGAGRNYRYQVIATGTPPPNFSLETAPQGMAIDPDTGLITWTAPNTVGQTVNVRVVAQNVDPTQVAWATVATQNFTISIRAEDDDNDDVDTDTGTATNTDTDSGGGSSSGGSGGCFIRGLFSMDNVSPGHFIGWLMIAVIIGMIGIRLKSE